ncbi:MAG TPA: ABC transporter permease [Candidatus Nitrosotalea sp.]|jgi:putative spermidine/putrescine transport system permease protein|nr:ABC transporter permease [Candidatus Nitrosotalea sp.]
MIDFGRSSTIRSAKTLGWLGALFLLLPSFVIIPVSFTTHHYLSLPDEGLSLQHYQNLFSNPLWLGAIGQSLLIAALSSLLAVVAGTMGAIGLWRLASRFSDALRNVLLLPLIVPPIISALAFYKAWVKLGLLDSYAGIVIAHAILAVPYVIITVTTSLSNFDPKLEQAARNLGASAWTAMRLIIVPVIKPGILSGAVLAFLASWDEIVVTLFISSQRIMTLPKAIWNGIRDNIDPTVAAVGSLVILVSLVATCWRLVQQSRATSGG